MVHDFSSFTREPLLAILHELNVDIPVDITLADLQQLVSDTADIVGEKAFLEAVLKANGYHVTIANNGSHKLVHIETRDRNLDSGVGVLTIVSETYDPRSSTYLFNS